MNMILAHNCWTAPITQVKESIFFVAIFAPFFVFGFLFLKWLAWFPRFAWLKGTPRRRYILPSLIAVIAGIAGIASLAFLAQYDSPWVLVAFFVLPVLLTILDIFLCVSWIRKVSRKPIIKAKNFVESAKLLGDNAKSKTKEWIAQQKDG